MVNEVRTLLSNQVYDVAKWFAQIGLPAVGALYFGLAEIWNLPNAAQVVGTITVVDAFLGVLLGLSTSSYNKKMEQAESNPTDFDGSIELQETGDGRKTYLLKLNGDPEDLEFMDKVVFRVEK
jgi:hypothetical protein